jgi:hypothetical protein
VYRDVFVEDLQVQAGSVAPARDPERLDSGRLKNRGGHLLSDSDRAFGHRRGHDQMNRNYESSESHAAILRAYGAYFDAGGRTKRSRVCHAAVRAGDRFATAASNG